MSGHESPARARRRDSSDGTSAGVAAAARALRRLDLDLVHVQFAPSVFGSSRAVGLLPLFLPRRIPFVVTLHEYGVWSGPGRVRSVLWSAAERRGYVEPARRCCWRLGPRACWSRPGAPGGVGGPLLPPFAGGFEVPIGLNVEVATGDRPRPGRGAARARRGTEAPLVVSSVSCTRRRRSTS